MTTFYLRVHRDIHWVCEMVYVVEVIPRKFLSVKNQLAEGFHADVVLKKKQNAEGNLESGRTSTMELFCENS